MTTQGNPFYHSGPVTDDLFSDRAEEMGRLLELLSTTPPTSIALYGPERIGKTSLLRRLCEVEGPRALKSRHLVYLDMQRIFTVGDFVHRFLQEMGGTGGECADLEGETGREYANFEEAIIGAGKPVVLCLDEFGKVLANEAFNADFYDFMRSLTQTGRLALVISTLRPPRELTVPSGADVSRFFNIFRPFPLGVFSEEAARELVRRGGFTDEEVEWVLRNVREPNHPYHLQLLGAALFEAKQTGRRREEALRAYLEALEDVAPPPPSRPAEAPAPARLPTEVFVRITLALTGLSLLVAVFSNLPLFYWVTLLLGALAILGFVVGILIGLRSEE